MESDIQQKYQEVDTGDILSFDDCQTPLDMALYVLWVAKDKVGIRKLSAQQISSILIDAHEVSITKRSIIQALNKAGNKVHRYREDKSITFEIMKAGKEHLTSLKGKGNLSVLYFEPEKRYSSKRLLVNDILEPLSGELRIIDPYCGERTFDVIKDTKCRPIKFLTKIENIKNKNAKNKLLRELQDFKIENKDIEFRDYQHKDLHDRYIISANAIVLLGHSIKDLGAKESFAVVLNETSSKNIYEALSQNFDRRWKQSDLL
jgi:hypothetical protein